MSCDFCRKHFHANCQTQPVSPDDDEFKCSYCEASGKCRRLACGQCSGCQREMDCMTCVYCVNKYYRGIGKKKKCLFRRCQSWGKNKTEKDSNNIDHGEVEEDHHDVECFICKNGGGTCSWFVLLPSQFIYRFHFSYHYLIRFKDMICCDGCTKVYHSSCHKPKIYDLPEGDWYCMECNQSRKAYKRKYTGSLIADVGHRELKCTVRFPKITCITCDEVEGEAITHL